MTVAHRRRKKDNAKAKAAAQADMQRLIFTYMAAMLAQLGDRYHIDASTFPLLTAGVHVSHQQEDDGSITLTLHWPEAS